MRVECTKKSTGNGLCLIKHLKKEYTMKTFKITTIREGRN
ncbi:hypothetical protein [Streptococcus phage pST]|nr:hypothetical protein [Streptococcus phage pST]